MAQLAPTPSPPPLESSSSSSFKSKLVSPFITRALLTISRIAVSNPTSTGLHIDVSIALTRCSALATEIEFISGFQLWSSPSGRIGDSDEVLVATAGKESTKGSVSCKEGYGAGNLSGQIELNGQEGASWIDRIVNQKGPVATSIAALISIKVKAAHVRCPSYLLRRAFSIDGLGGFDGACSPDSSIGLSNVQAAPMSTSKDGIALYAELPLRNPSTQLSLKLGRMICTMEKRGVTPAQAVGTATIDVLDLPPLATTSLRVKILIFYGAIAEAAGASLVGMIMRDSRLSGLQLVIKGEHKLGGVAEAGEEGVEERPMIEANWLRDMLDRTPLYINFPDTLKIVQGVTFGSGWL